MSQFKFSIPVKVRYNDTDRQGHVYFGNYYQFFDEGVDGYLDEIGYGDPEMIADNTDFLYAASHCEYKSSATWPEIINIYTRVGYLGNKSLRFEFEIKAETDNRLIAIGHIAVVTADRKSFTPHPVPDAFRQAILAYEGSNVETSK